MVVSISDHIASAALNAGQEEQLGVERIESLIRCLKSLNRCDRAVLDLIEFGRAAVPALEQLLYERDPSGIFEPRCRAVTALKAIGTRDVLMKFLASPHEVMDPCERLGEEAVVNAAARALIGWHAREFYELLLKMAERQFLPGVIEAIADFRRSETAQVLVAALAEDFSRWAAEEGLRNLGEASRKPLVHAARWKDPSPEWESPSSLRRRKSALQLLLEIGITPGDWDDLRDIVHEDDPAIACVACELSLSNGTPEDRKAALQRMIELLPRADWFLAGEIEDHLIRNFSIARQLVDEKLGGSQKALGKGKSWRRVFRTLNRVKARGETAL